MNATAAPGRRSPPVTTTLTTTAAILMVALALIAATRATLHRALELRAGWPAEDDTLSLPGATALRVASLGHTEAAADLVAARTNVYFGAQVAARGDSRWLERYLATALDLDPSFHGLYRRGATMLVYTGKEFSVDALLGRRPDPHARRARVPQRLGDLVPARVQPALRAAAARRRGRRARARVAPARRRGAAPGDAARRRSALAAQPGGADADQAGRPGAGAAPPGADLRGHQRRGDARADPPQAGVAARYDDRRRARARGGGSAEARRRSLPLRARGVFVDRGAALRSRPRTPLPQRTPRTSNPKEGSPP